MTPFHWNLLCTRSHSLPFPTLQLGDQNPRMFLCSKNPTLASTAHTLLFWKSLNQQGILPSSFRPRSASSDNEPQGTPYWGFARPTDSCRLESALLSSVNTSDLHQPHSFLGSSLIRGYHVLASDSPPSPSYSSEELPHWVLFWRRWNIRTISDLLFPQFNLISELISAANT